MRYSTAATIVALAAGASAAEVYVPSSSEAYPVQETPAYPVYEPSTSDYAVPTTTDYESYEPEPTGYETEETPAPYEPYEEEPEPTEYPTEETPTGYEPYEPETYPTPSAEEYPVYTTEVVTAYSTYCPSATTIVHGSETYTVTEATTLTITNCPCTVTKPVTYSTVTECKTCSVYVPSEAAPTPVAPYPTPEVPSNATVVYPTGTGAPVASPPAFQGAANRAVVASGAGVAAVLGFLAYLL